MRPGGCGRRPAHLAAQRRGSARRVGRRKRGGSGRGRERAYLPAAGLCLGAARGGPDGAGQTGRVALRGCAWGRGPCEAKGKGESWKRRRPTRAHYPFLHLTPRPRPQRVAPSWKNDGYDGTVPRAHLGTSKAGWCPPFKDTPPPLPLGLPPPPSAEPHWGRWSCVGPAHPPPSPASLRDDHFTPRFLPKYHVQRRCRVNRLCLP